LLPNLAVKAKYEKTQHQLRVLIIEGHQDTAQNIGDYLSLQGHIVDCAMDGISGMHLALTLDFDVIDLDLMLPGKTFCPGRIVSSYHSFGENWLFDN
jgi:CheY-like chemotaxis protein